MSEKIRNILFKYDVLLNEILGVAYGTKPSVLYALEDRTVEEFKQIFPNLYFLNGGYGSNPVDKQNHTPNYAIAKDETTAKDLIEAQNINDHISLGRLLGYPECCIRNHYNRSFSTGSKEMIIRSCENSKNFSYLLNNIFNFHSRLNDSKEHFDKFSIYGKQNAYVPRLISQLELISHIPCSYDCEDSIAIGEEARSLMQEYFPEETLRIEATLRKKILFFNMFEWIVFDGDVISKKELRYKDVVWPISLIDKNFILNLKKGNIIKLLEENVQVFNNDKHVYTFEHPLRDKGIILDFK